MSDVSINYSVESRASSPAPSSGPTLVAPPRMSISPNSANNIMEARDDLDAATLRGIAEGLVATIKGRDAMHRAERARLTSRVEGLEQRLQHYTDIFEQPPPGYVNNGTRLPAFTIPIPGSGGLSTPAKWVKLLDDGKAAGYSQDQGPSDLPTIADIFLSPSYDNTGPFEPLPHWFRHLLNGNNAQYHQLREAVGALDNWAHLAEIKRYRQLEDDVNQAQSQINSLRADIEGWSQARDLCEGRIAAGRTHEQVAHLQGQQPRQLGARGGTARRARFMDGRGRRI
jgi:hypothetical protein